MSTMKGYTRVAFATTEGMITYEFDFFVPVPTWEELEALVPHSCATCQWQNEKHSHYCPEPEVSEGGSCVHWILSRDGLSKAKQAYYERFRQNP